MSLPVRTIFLAHGTAKTGVNARGEQHCYHSHNEIRPAPCSTEDGAPPYMEPSACKIWVEPWTFQPCITADTFVVVGSTTTQCASNSAAGECRFNTHPHWFELSEVKLFNEAGLDVALYADKVELLLQPSNPQDVAEINDGEFWGDKGRFVVWNEDYEPFAGQPLVRLSFNDPQSVVGAELYTTNCKRSGSVRVFLRRSLTDDAVQTRASGSTRRWSRSPPRAMTSRWRRTCGRSASRSGGRLRVATSGRCSRPSRSC